MKDEVSMLAALGRYLPEAAMCLKCGRAPDSVTIEEDPWTAGEWWVTYRCHGAFDFAVISYLDMRPSRFEVLARHLKRCFLRSVACHGQLGQAGRLMRASRYRPR